MGNGKLPILSVKFRIPEPRADYIVRKNLFKKLEQIGKYQVTIVKAGAGCGKSTLLSSYIKEYELASAVWITMDSSMDQAFCFWSYLFQALKHYTDDAMDSLHACFEGNVPSELLEQMLGIFADALNPEADVLIVLDDFQTMKDAFLLETLQYFFTIMPSRIHVVLLTREMPDMYLGGLIMDGRLLVIDDEELRLDQSECKLFLKTTLGIQEAQQIQEISENANGWIGGAQLMAIASGLKKVGGSVYASADEQVIFDYIEHEIYQPLSDQEKELLRLTAPLSYFSKEICTRLLPDCDFDQTMKQIMEKNLFVVCMDEEREVFQYHAIIREFVLQLEHGEDAVQRYRQAAAIFFDLQDYDEGIRLLFLCEDYEPLMERLLQMPQNVVTSGYMMRVPMQEIVKNANFAYQYFFCYYVLMDVEQCNKIYSFINENMKEDETFKAFEHTDLFFNVNWEFEDIPIMTRDRIASLPLNRVTRAYLLIKEAYFLFLADHADEALKYLDEAERIYQDTGNLYIRCFIMIEKTQIYEAYGELRKSLLIYRELAAVIDHIPTLQSSYYVGIAGLHIRQLRLKEAKAELDAAKAYMAPGVETINSAYLYTLAEWYYVSGHAEDSEAILLSLANDKMYQSVFFSARLLRYPIYRGRNQELAENFLNNYKQSNSLSRNMDADLLYAGILYEQGYIDEAKAAVEKLAAKARKIHNKMKIVECALLLAGILHEQKQDEKRVGNLLIEAITYACEEQLALPFWFEKMRLSSMCEAHHNPLIAAISSEEAAFLRRILNNEGGVQVKPQNRYSLTSREMDVLEEMMKEYTNREIADHLCISLATVKTHLINIYGKLGVRNRLAAVNKMKRSE